MLSTSHHSRALARIAGTTTAMKASASVHPAVEGEARVLAQLDMAAGWQGKQRNFSFDNLGRLQQTAHRNFLSCSPFVEDDGYSCTPWVLDSTHT